jgi:alkyldihydroxyacetonephosphate synthase
MRARAGQAVEDCLVARPNSPEELAEALAWASEAGLAVVAVGGRSGVCGAVDVGPRELALDFSGLNRILEIDPVNLSCRAQAGVHLGDLEAELNSRGLTLGHHPTSLARAQLGGLVSTRSCGQESTRYGGIEDMIMGARAILADGTSLPLRAQARSAAGPALHQLLVGAEGGLAVVVEVALRVARLPALVTGRGYGFESLELGLEAVREVMQRGLRPLVMRLYDQEDSLLQGAAEGCLLIAACGGEPEVTEAEAAVVAGICKGAADLGEEPWQRWLRHRYDLSAERLTDMLQPPGAVLETIELGAPWTVLPGLHADIKSSLAPTGLILCHFSHPTAQGCCAYFTFAGSAPTEAEASALYDNFWEVAMRAAQAHGATISHHHGVGQARAAWIRQELGEWWRVWEGIRTTLDPAGRLNPKALGGR